jgi:uncharacterized protein YndB with AHSA1/START domain
MPRNKDLKRLVRARMSKTGEAYTAARARITDKPKKATRATPDMVTKARVDYAEIAGMRDTAIREKTGRTWEEWTRTLDKEGAAQMSHRDIAQVVHAKFKVADWWTQTVTVGYERIKGLRARGQRRDGSYEASKSRTYNVPVTVLFDAWAKAARRRRWLNGASVKVRTATAPKSMRLGWDDGSIVAVGFYPKGASKSSVAVQHTRLRDRESAPAFREYWTERLDALGQLLHK